MVKVKLDVNARKWTTSGGMEVRSEEMALPFNRPRQRPPPSNPPQHGEILQLPGSQSRHTRVMLPAPATRVRD